MVSSPRVRRTQQERTADTRLALFEAAVAVINRFGYAGASTALIADEAGVSRGAILHHFGTRAELMAETVRWVYERELAEYDRVLGDALLTDPLAFWPELIWQVLSKPPGMAVLDILWATRSDTELAERVLPIQWEIEDNSAQRVQDMFGGQAQHVLASMRLLVWSIRGLTVASKMVRDPDAIKESVEMLRLLLARAVPSGKIDDLYT